MDIQELKPIIDLMTDQEERLARKINDVHKDVKLINSTVAKHEKFVNEFKVILKFIICIVTLGIAIFGAFKFI